MTGKEKQLATDPDCSVVLERMIHSMDDFVLRVFFDSLAGSWVVICASIIDLGPSVFLIQLRDVVDASFCFSCMPNVVYCCEGHSVKRGWSYRILRQLCCSLFSKMRGRLPEVQKSSEHGELRTMTQLILDICEVTVSFHVQGAL